MGDEKETDGAVEATDEDEKVLADLEVDEDTDVSGGRRAGPSKRI